MSVLCVIPARYGSSRLPAKALIEVKGLPLCMWAYNSACASGAFADVVVATDDDRIMEAVAHHNGKAVRTAATHVSGTDRVNEVAQQTAYSHVVNLQGDEPLVPPALLQRVASACIALDDKSLLTCVTHGTIVDNANPNVVKTVLNAQQEALYFSRSAIPYCRDDNAVIMPLVHVGIYAFSRAGLWNFCGLPVGKLEHCEKLEQLRALEHGMTIRCITSDYRPLGIDTAEDLCAFKLRVDKKNAEK